MPRCRKGLRAPGCLQVIKLISHTQTLYVDTCTAFKVSVDSRFSAKLGGMPALQATSRSAPVENLPIGADAESDHDSVLA